MRCEQFEDLITDYLEGTLAAPEQAPFESHLATCEDCRRTVDEVRWMTELMQSVPAEPMPADLPDRIHAALAALPDESPVTVTAPEPVRDGAVLAGAPVSATPWYKRLNWPSAMAGAVAAVAMLVVWNMQNSSLPRIETAVVQPNTDVAVNIGFDVAQSMDNVTFQIDLPEGLKFIDDNRQPLMAQSVSWKGSLKAGKTVVPVVVRGVQPGRYTIEAYVRKGPMMRKTSILLPVAAS